MFQDAAAVTATTEGSVDIQAVGADGEGIDSFMEQDRDMGHSEKFSVPGGGAEPTITRASDSLASQASQSQISK